MADQTDLELVQHAKTGNLEAFEELVKRFQKKVFYLSYRMCKDPDAADDIAQETFIKVYQNIGTFKEEYPFYTWICRICMNLAINYLRRQKFVIREAQLENFDQFIESQGVPDKLGEISEDEKLLETLRENIEQLPTDFKAVLILKTYENLSCTEIAGVLKIPLGTVLSRLARARERLARKMKVRRSE